MSQIDALLRALLRERRALYTVLGRSYWHPNGFAKLVLRQRRHTALRLHVWPPGDDRPGDGNPHTHIWRFGSTVLAGSLDDVHYRDVTGSVVDDAATAYDLHEFAHRNARGAMTYRRPARLVRTTVHRYATGDGYTLSPDVIHTVHPVGSSLVATLVRTERATRPTSLVYGDVGRDVDVPGRPITVDEGRNLLLCVLERQPKPLTRYTNQVIGTDNGPQENR